MTTNDPIKADARQGAGAVREDGLRLCDACCGTGEPSPWEWDVYVWLHGVPHAVCGACRGSGLLGRFGFRLSRRRTALLHKRFHDDPASLVRFLRGKGASGTDRPDDTTEAP